MHRFATSAQIRRLQISSILMLIWPLTLVALPLLLGRGMLFHDTQYLYWTLIDIGAILVLRFLIFLVGHSVRCPLCRGPLMSRITSSVNPKARRTLGSLKLNTATGVLFRGHFRCPSCGEHSQTSNPRRK